MPSASTDSLTRYIEDKQIGPLLDSLGAAVLKEKPPTHSDLLVFMRDTLMDEPDIIEALIEAVRTDERFKTLAFTHRDVSLTYYARTGTDTRWKEGSQLMKRELESTTLPQKIWPAAFAMSEFIAEGGLSPHLQGKLVLELGSGVGLAGFVAAACGARSVHFSDMALASLAICKLTATLQGDRARRCHVRKLSWGSQPDCDSLLAHLRQETGDPSALFDTVVGTDVFYFRNSLKLGVTTAYDVLRTGGVFLCASAVRSDEMESALHAVGDDPRWNLLEEPFMVRSSSSHEGKVHSEFDGILLFKWQKKAPDA